MTLFLPSPCPHNSGPIHWARGGAGPPPRAPGLWHQRRFLGCSTVRASRNSLFMIQQSRLVLPLSSCVAIPHCVGMSLYGASLRVSVALLQGVYSQTETNMHGERVRHKIASREGMAWSVVAPRPLSAPPASGKWAEWHDSCCRHLHESDNACFGARYSKTSLLSLPSTRFGEQGVEREWVEEC